MFDENDNVKGISLLHTLKAHKDVIHSISWSPDGKKLASASHDQSVRIYNIGSDKSKDLRKPKSSYCVSSVAWSPDGKKLASGGDDLFISIWNTQNWQLLEELDKHTAWITSIKWSPDGQNLASAAADNSIVIWDTNNWSAINILKKHSHFVRGLAWSPNGKFLASCSSDHKVFIWNSENWEYKIFERHSHFVLDIAWSPDGSLLASCSQDKTILIWNIETGKPTQIITGHTDAITSISFSVDSSLLASKSWDGTVKLWRVFDGFELASINELSKKHRPSTLAFHPSQYILATLGQNETAVYIWDVNPKKIQENKHIQSSVNFINAKVILLGNSGVGKSGLGIRMAENIFRTTKSTHGAQFWQIPLPKNTFSASLLDDKIHAEITIWDLAGQPDYHLIHQLFLDDANVALLLFDCSDAADPFRGVPYWAKVLKKQAPTSAFKYLVSARCDVSPVTVDQKEINSKLVEYELDDYFCTSAFTGQGIDELLQHILNKIPWDKLPRTSTPKLFQITREYLLEQKESGKTLLSFDEVKTKINKIYREEGTQYFLFKD